MDEIAIFMRDAKRYPRLTPEEEVDLARRGERDRLVECNLRFAVSVAAKYRRCGIDIEDLVALASAGLVDAAASYDPDSGNRFISYAVWHCRKRILAAIQDHTGSGVRLPRNRSVEAQAVRKAQDDIWARTGREATEEELLEATGAKSVQKLRDVMAAAANPVPLDADREDTDDPMIDAVLGGHTPDHDDAAAKLRHELEDRLAGLADRERGVLLAYYNEAAPSLDAIGRSGVLGKPMSREAVRLQKVAGLRALRSAV